jgi:hypothetical protein
MENHFALANRIVNPFVTLDIALDQLDLVERVGEVLTIAGRKVVENSDFMAVIDKAGNKVRANESGAPSDKDSHGGHYIPTSPGHGDERTPLLAELP